MKSLIQFMLFMLFFIITSIQCFGQTCCSGGVPLSNNLGIPNDGKGAFTISLNYDYNNLNTLNFKSTKLDNNNRQRITNSVLLNANYAITDKFAIETLFTWLSQGFVSPFGGQDLNRISGVGDAVVLAKYSFPELIGKNTLLDLGLGVKAPLGRTDRKSDLGIQLTADLQPGSGAWDGLAWLTVSKSLNFRPSSNIYGNFTYRETGVNSSYLTDDTSYEFGNELYLNIGYSDQFIIFNTIFNPALVFKYRQAQFDKLNNQNLPNTGGEWIFIRPEIMVLLTPNIFFNTRVELPLYSYVQGTQLTPTIRLTTGIMIKIMKKETLKLNN